MSSGFDTDILYLNDLSGGLDTKNGPFAISDNAALTAKNVVFSGRGPVKCRPGYSLVSSNTLSGCTSINHIFRNYYLNSRESLVSATAGANERVYRYSTYAAAGELLQGGTAFTAGKVRMVDYKGFVFMYDGVSTFKWYQYGLAAATALTDVIFYTPDPLDYKALKSDVRCMAVCDDRLFVVFESEPDTLWYTDYGAWSGADPGVSGLIFPIENFINIPERTSDMLGILAIDSNPDSDDLTACRANEAWALEGVGGSDYQLRKIAGATGTISKDGIAKGLGAELFVAGNDQISYVSGGSWYPIAINIPDWTESIDLQNSVACYDVKNDRIYFTHTLGVLCGSIAREGGFGISWSHLDITVNTLARFREVVDNNDILMALKSDTHIYQMNTGILDNAATVNWNFKTKYFDWEEFVEPKFLRNIYILHELKTGVPYYVIIHVVKQDGGESAMGPFSITPLAGGAVWTSDPAVSVWGDTTWSSGKKSYAMSGIGDEIQGVAFAFEFYGSTPITIHRIGIEYRIRARRRSLTQN